MSASEFDAYKDRYREAVQSAIAFAGMNVDYCTEAKAEALLEICRRRLGATSRLQVLDLGCGVGLSDSYLASAFRTLWGVDVSPECLATAARRNPGVHYQVYEGDTLPFADGTFDVVFAICVLHHVGLDQRARFVAEMHRVVRQGGLTVVFEHNPFNPLTRMAVSRCPFDAGVVLLRPKGTAQLLTRSGLEVVERRYILFFPFRSRILRAVEGSLHMLPLGGQYYMVGRRVAAVEVPAVATAA
ncbi:MAG: class I SAM-dependent methyltransferase [Planctomycetes bacterium]|nr:class I SAM-dependent methyltransferase [Planctomycetota bacterium]